MPVHLICGFLGAGKTTLMNRLLSELDPALRPAVVVNDFGSVPVDATLLERHGYAVKSLPSGCVCCTLRGPFEDALVGLADEQDPGVIVLETSGIVRPADLPVLFSTRSLKERVHIGNVVCLVDAGAFLRLEPSLVVIGDQVRQANIIVINKTDLADQQTVRAVERRVRYLSQPDAIIVTTTQALLAVDVLLDERPVYFETRNSEALQVGSAVPSGNARGFEESDHDAVNHDHAAHDGTHGFLSFTWESVSAFDCDRLAAALRELVGQIERCKGVVATTDGPKLVQLTPDGVTMESWDEEVPASRLVFVGRRLDRATIESSLHSAAASSDQDRRSGR